VIFPTVSISTPILQFSKRVVWRGEERRGEEKIFPYLISPYLPEFEEYFVLIEVNGS
jgi:hypothetical protein